MICERGGGEKIKNKLSISICAIPRKAEFERIAYFALIYYSNHSRCRAIMHPLGEKIRLDFILENGRR